MFSSWFKHPPAITGAAMGSRACSSLPTALLPKKDHRLDTRPANHRDTGRAREAWLPGVAELVGEEEEEDSLGVPGASVPDLLGRPSVDEGVPLPDFRLLACPRGLGV